VRVILISSTGSYQLKQDDEQWLVAFRLNRNYTFAMYFTVIDLAIGWAETYRLIGKSSVAGADHVA